FFFQAEDGIRDQLVTGVQTCALPISGLSEPINLELSEDTLDDIKVSSKMSKSKPTSGIIIHDDENTIRENINRAFCPIGIVERRSEERRVGKSVDLGD